MSQLVSEVRAELIDHIIPFWKGLRDDARGGYVGLVEYDLTRRPGAVKGCILNSRILWFSPRRILPSGTRACWRRPITPMTCSVA